MTNGRNSNQKKQTFEQIWILQSRAVNFKVLVKLLYSALSGDTVIIPVMSQQYNSLMELYTHQKKILFMKMDLPSTFILRYVRAKMIVHAFMFELDQLDY